MKLEGIASDGASQFGILANSKMFGILSSKIYTDKILAPVRELSCNAYDANIMAARGNEPIAVHLPDELEPWFSVADRGEGMGDETLEKLYTTYGASSKADDNSVIGCLGLGSKSPFAYTDEFTVSSVRDGIRRTYVCRLEESVPFLKKVSEEAASGVPSGTVVSFAVKKKDFFSFKCTASEFFANFSPKPVFNGGFTPNPPLQFDEYGLAESFHFGVLMGNVVYEYDIKAFNDKTNPLYSDFFKLFSSRKSYVLKVELGDIDISVSREQVEMTQKSKDFIASRFLGIVDGVLDKLRSLEGTCPTRLAFLKSYKGKLMETPYVPTGELDELTARPIAAFNTSGCEAMMVCLQGSQEIRCKRREIVLDGGYSVFSFQLGGETRFYYAGNNLRGNRYIDAWAEERNGHFAVVFTGEAMKKALEDAGYKVWVKQDYVPERLKRGDRTARPRVLDTEGVFEVTAHDTNVFGFTRFTGSPAELFNETNYYLRCTSRCFSENEKQRLRNEGLNLNLYAARELLDYAARQGIRVFGVNDAKYEAVKHDETWRSFTDYVIEEFSVECPEYMEALAFKAQTRRSLSDERFEKFRDAGFKSYLVDMSYFSVQMPVTPSPKASVMLELYKRQLTDLADDSYRLREVLEGLFPIAAELIDSYRPSEAAIDEYRGIIKRREEEFLAD